MNRKAEFSLEQAIASPIGMVIMFIVMLLFVIVAGAIAKNHEISENMPEDFMNTYLVFNDEVVQVGTLIDRFCDDADFGEKLKVSLREHFVEEYGRGSIFILSYTLDDDGSIKIISWAGAVDNYIDMNGDISDYDAFNKIVDYNDEKSVKRICNRIDIFVKRSNT
ncbi:hypothetical protein J4423_05080 [Candidatus Pacearchaeota archaeon]|nr:hypothetical protein [Candidatus Pacearchaeota archaeon]